METTRVINWNVQGWMSVLLYGGAFVATALAAWRLGRRVRVWLRGRPADAKVTFGQAVKNVVRWMTRGGRMARDPFAATLHHLILWGFIILFIGTTLVFLEHQTPLHFFYGTFYLVASFIIDLGGVAFLAGLGMAVWRRYVRKKARLKTSAWTGAMIWLLLMIGVTGFLLEGARIGVTLPAFERVSFVGYGIALGLRAAGVEPTILHRVLWVSHAVLSVAFFGLSTVFFFRHALVSMLAVALKPERPAGALRPYEPAAIPAGVVTDLTRKDLLDADACTSCGRCTSVCPASAAGKALDPRALVLGIADLVGRGAGASLDALNDQALWDCTTCGLCVLECPVEIEVFHKLIDVRRQRVDQGRVSPAVRASLESVRDRKNPWNYAPSQRTAWADTLGLPVLAHGPPPEWVYWIGCAGSFDPSGIAVSRAMVQILRKAKVDFAVLGSEERCTGDPARRLGDESLFQSCKQKNLETLRRRGVKKVITHCPHCLNSFRNEYGAPELEVVHHSQFLWRLLDQGKVKLTRPLEQKKTTFHDPCYLGRMNGEFEAPRKIVDAIPGVERLEMGRSKENSFCCGGGGGQMWLESSGTTRVEGIRVAEAQETGAETVATACPFCKVMFESASSTLRVKDVAELVVEAMEV